MSTRGPRCISRVAVLLALLPFVNCGAAEPTGPARPMAQKDSPSGSPNARRETVRMLRLDLEAERHAADGGGRAWLKDPENEKKAVAGRAGRWTIVYAAGPLGVAEGGLIFLQVPPFWGWSEPQTDYPSFPGLVRASTEAEGVDLAIEIPDRQLVALRVTGRALREGERVEIVYGAGDAGAIADRFAERDSPFWISVDGDGDGVRKILEDSPKVDVGPGPPARFVLTIPTTARPGQKVRMTLAFLDAIGNAGCPVEGGVAWQEPPAGLDLPPGVALDKDDRGRKTVEFVAREEGVYRLRASGPGGLTAESNPMVVSPHAPRVLWGDLQIHSNFSDGSGVPEDIYLYARDVAALDVAALTDHDHWGMLFLDSHPSMWEEVRRQAKRFNEPGRFVTFLGFEWTNWLYGHRHVLYPGDDGRVLSSIDPSYETPAGLWEALRGTGAITIAHHTAGDPVATDWSIRPDPRFETVSEIVSVHGSSEAADSPTPVRGAYRGHFVRDALDRGYRLGFVGSGDGHDGHPGLTWIAAGIGGMAGILSEDLTREGVLEAIRARRVYATSGPRVFLRVALDGEPMGSVLAASDRERKIAVEAIAPRAIDHVDLIRSGRVIERIPCEARRECSFTRVFADFRSGEYLYVRVIQQNGGLAWSSPFFLD
jgi:hypothetical protein